MRRGRKKRRKKGDKSKNGRSATLVVMYTLRRGVDGRLHGPCNKKVYGTFGTRQAALNGARAQATRRGFPPGTDKTVQIVIDGELCLEQRCRQLFRGAILTLDIRHAQEKLWAVGRLFHREGSAELARWVEELEGLLYKGHIRTLLRQLEQELRGVSLRGPGTRPKRQALKAVIGSLDEMARGARRGGVAPSVHRGQRRLGGFHAVEPRATQPRAWPWSGRSDSEQDTDPTPTSGMNATGAQPYGLHPIEQHGRSPP
jgi:hypothetical protein